jgi:hypothetical protein
VYIKASKLSPWHASSTAKSPQPHAWFDGAPSEHLPFDRTSFRTGRRCRTFVTAQAAVEGFMLKVTKYQSDNLHSYNLKCCITGARVRRVKDFGESELKVYLETLFQYKINVMNKICQFPLFFFFSPWHRDKEYAMRSKNEGFVSERLAPIQLRMQPGML